LSLIDSITILVSNCKWKVKLLSPYLLLECRRNKFETPFLTFGSQFPGYFYSNSLAYVDIV